MSRFRRWCSGVSFPRAGIVLLATLTAAGTLSCGGATGPGDVIRSGAASVVISPDGLTLLVGGTGGLTAAVRDSSQLPMSAAGVRWSSLNSSIASVAANGVVTGVSVGSTRVIAADGNVADSVDVLVVQTLTLQIVPASANVVVGGTAEFTVIARNAAGQVVTVPPAVWASGNTAVGIVLGGFAVGLAPGTTPITASVSGVTSPPALLTVGAAALACDGIEMTPGWNVTLSFAYAAGLTNGDNHQLSVSHSGNFTAILTPLGGVLPAIGWEGSLAGTVSINDRDTHLNSTPVVVETLVGTGAPVTGAGYSVFSLSVNLTTCTYTFAVSPFSHVTHTTVADNTTVQEGNIPVGNIQAADPLGSWRALGLSGLGASFDAHFVTALNRGGKDTYYPFGVGQLLWSHRGSLDAPEGAATVSYTIIRR